MKATFENSLSVLVLAYINDTLTHLNCTACAVGNLIAAAHGCKMVADEKMGRGYFQWIDENGQRKFVHWLRSVTTIFRDEDQEQDILWTGYSVEELRQIESAFEKSNKGNTLDEWMFNGLIAVVDVLAEIHGVDLTVKENAIGQFQKVHATK